jgi:hypothetical protein
VPFCDLARDANTLSAFLATRDVPGTAIPDHIAGSRGTACARAAWEAALIHAWPGCTAGLPHKGQSTPFKNTVRYNERESLAFLLGRTPSNFATALRAFTELKALAGPAFRPTSLLDFGSGVGSTLW